MATLDDYAEIDPQLLDNFQQDKNLGLHAKQRFLDALESFPGVSPADLKTWMNEKVFHKKENQLIGPKAKDVLPNQVLGTTKILEGFSKRLAGKEFLDKADPRVCEETLRRISKRDKDSQLRWISRVFKSEESVSPHLNWSFIVDDADTLETLDHEKLPCALGLPSHVDAKGDHITFGHTISPPDAARIPTCLDAGCFPQWRPGGRTKPYADCESDFPDGFQEVVHKQLIPRRIATSFKIA